MWPLKLSLLFLLALVYTAESNQFNELVGGSVTFRADHGNTATEITWKKGDDKLADVESNIAPYFYILGDRASADLSSGTLTIRNLIVSDSAMYTAEVLIHGQYDKRHFKLTVFDAVPQPNGTCTRNQENVTLHCTFPPSPSTIVTLQNSSNITVCNTTTCTITMATEGDVTCYVRNPVSKKNFTLHCPAPDADILERSHITIAVVVVVLTLIVLAVVAVLFWIKKRNRGKKNENPEDPQQNQPLITDSNNAAESESDNKQRQSDNNIPEQSAAKEPDCSKDETTPKPNEAAESDNKQRQSDNNIPEQSAEKEPDCSKDETTPKHLPNEAAESESDNKQRQRDNNIPEQSAAKEPDCSKDETTPKPNEAAESESDNKQRQSDNNIPEQSAAKEPDCSKDETTPKPNEAAESDNKQRQSDNNIPEQSAEKEPDCSKDETTPKHLPNEVANEQESSELVKQKESEFTAL
ncbi:lymphocyte function-associated antigen 3 isoform X4 [Bombina bombina]|uniref:lymphocyte function-associated antigen 3 isoform X4 n=1 Tax=Bombina bombina TaxID=8345 RepID=UPI00235AB36F|nr:lymphocyte function-associated antigen 3 isoform X4 [Bombina bombina]